MNNQSIWSISFGLINLFALGVGLAYTISRLEFRMQLIENRVSAIEDTFKEFRQEQNKVNIDLIVETRYQAKKINDLELKK
jgi:hypothetical protein